MDIFHVYWVVQKVIAFFPIDGVVHIYLYTSVTWMSNVYARFVVDTRSKNQKKSWCNLVEFCACNCGSNIENFEEHIRHILFYHFKKGKKATEARKKLRRVYGRNVKKRQCQNWSNSVMVIFQSKTLIAPVGLPRLTTMKWKHWFKQINIQRFGSLLPL